MRGCAFGAAVRSVDDSELSVFHVFQPLAPRSAMDPGEFTYPGFNRWVKTWCVDLVSTSEVYWNGNSDKIEIKNLPPRAFDSPATI